MPAADPSLRTARDRARRAGPWLVLLAGLTAATLPAWRPLLFGPAPGLDALLGIRCLPE